MLHFEDQHVRAIVDYLKRGSNNDCTRCLGIEIEHFIVDLRGKRAVAYADDPVTGAVGVCTILEELTPYYPDTTHSIEPDGSKHLIGLSRPGVLISLEPGAQLEISIGPVSRIASLAAYYAAFRAELDPILEKYGLDLLALGYQPFAQAADIPLIPKQRYFYMNEHFTLSGRHGTHMMRASASTQVSVDFDDETDALRKLRIANAVSPLLAFLTDNSPVFECRQVGSSSTGGSNKETLDSTDMKTPPRLVRTMIWDDVDPARCLLAPGSMDANYSFQAYAKTLLSTPAIFAKKTDTGGLPVYEYTKNMSFAELYAGRALTREDIEHIISLVFFDNRLKTYIEIRLADSLPIAYALAYQALVSGLFYNSGNLDWLEARFQEVTASTVAEAKTLLRRDAWDADVYGHNATEWLEALVARAENGLDESERFYLKPLADLVARRTTLLDEQLAGRLALGSGGGSGGLDEYGA